MIITYTPAEEAEREQIKKDRESSEEYHSLMEEYLPFSDKVKEFASGLVNQLNGAPQTKSSGLTLEVRKILSKVLDYDRETERLLQEYEEKCQKERIDILQRNGKEAILKDIETQFNLVLERAKSNLDNALPWQKENFTTLFYKEDNVYKLVSDYPFKCFLQEIQQHEELLKSDYPKQYNKAGIKKLEENYRLKLLEQPFIYNSLLLTPQAEIDIKEVILFSSQMASLYGSRDNLYKIITRKPDKVYFDAKESIKTEEFNVHEFNDIKTKVQLILRSEEFRNSLDNQILDNENLDDYSIIASIYIYCKLYYHLERDPKVKIYYRFIWNIKRSKDILSRNELFQGEEFLKIDRSVRRLRDTDIKIEQSEELQGNKTAYKKKVQYAKTNKLLIGEINYLTEEPEIIDNSSGEKKTVTRDRNTYIEVEELPRLFQYFYDKNNLEEYPLIESSVGKRSTPEYKAFKSYINKEIAKMKPQKFRKGKRQRFPILALDNIYRYSKIETPEQKAKKMNFESEAKKKDYIKQRRNKDRKQIESILKEDKANKVIYDYKVQKKGYSISGYEIILKKPPEAKSEKKQL